MSAPAPKPRGFRQARCAGCGLTAATCVCASHAPLATPIAISVVMTRSEARSASNSARLLALWLSGVELHVHGGQGARGRAEDAGTGGLLPETLVARPGSALLFPGASPAEPLPTGVQHLIVPDGTWSQARRIERRCFAAKGLPRVSLDTEWPSSYGLRRARPGSCHGIHSDVQRSIHSDVQSGVQSNTHASLPSGLCTFEATALALGLLGHAPLAQLLLERFLEWVRRAQRLKAGGGGAIPPTSLGVEREPHPAAQRLASFQAWMTGRA